MFSRVHNYALGWRSRLYLQNLVDFNTSLNKYTDFTTVEQNLPQGVIND